MDADDTRCDRRCVGRGESAGRRAGKIRAGQEWREGWDEVMRTETEMRHKHRLTYARQRLSSSAWPSDNCEAKSGRASSKALSRMSHVAKVGRSPNLSPPPPSTEQNNHFLHSKNLHQLQAVKGLGRMLDSRVRDSSAIPTWKLRGGKKLMVPHDPLTDLWKWLELTRLLQTRK